MAGRDGLWPFEDWSALLQQDQTRDGIECQQLYDSDSSHLAESKQLFAERWWHGTWHMARTVRAPATDA